MSKKYTANDFANILAEYKLKGAPNGQTLHSFCRFRNVPYNLFIKWYKDTRNKIVPVDVIDEVVTDEDDLVLQQKYDQPEHPQDATVAPEAKEAAPQPATEDRVYDLKHEGHQHHAVRILADIRINNGVRVRKYNLDYNGLRSLVEKLEALC